jgi:hypothetical protein
LPSCALLFCPLTAQQRCTSGNHNFLPTYYHDVYPRGFSLFGPDLAYLQAISFRPVLPLIRFSFLLHPDTLLPRNTILTCPTPKSGLPPYFPAPGFCEQGLQLYTLGPLWADGQEPCCDAATQQPNMYAVRYLVFVIRQEKEKNK